MFTRFAAPVAFALMLAARPAPAADPGFIGLQLGADENGKGLLVMGVLPDSPGEKAGLKKGDVITDMDGSAVTDIRAFAGTVGAKKPGDEVTFKVTRDGKEQTFKVKVGKRPEER